MKAPEHLVLSRPDSIGDVMLTLPMAGLLKQRYPGLRITFIGRDYTAPVLRHCRHVDEVLTLEQLQVGDAVAQLQALQADTLVHVFPQRQVAAWARQAGIPVRIGTAHRWWHWTTCTHRVRFSRRKSDLHEAQLNLRLLEPLGFGLPPSTVELGRCYGLVPGAPDAAVRGLLRTGRSTVLLHPGSRGSAVEWGLDRFARLMERLPGDRYQVVVTGTRAEQEAYAQHLPLHLPHVHDAGGVLSLDQLIALIGVAQALVAASTGPLHIAAACGKRAIGLYAGKRPIHPGRWAPLGPDAHALLPLGMDPGSDPRAQVEAITVDQVLAALEAPGLPVVGEANTKSA